MDNYYDNDINSLLMATLLSFSIYTLVILQLQIKHMRNDVLC